tara:strand:+ start:919 stop:1140 length:222 start_codon:yes stop_codon:yes gene_type:complete
MVLTLCFHSNSRYTFMETDLKVMYVVTIADHAVSESKQNDYNILESSCHSFNIKLLQELLPLLTYFNAVSSFL